MNRILAITSGVMNKTGVDDVVDVFEVLMRWAKDPFFTPALAERRGRFLCKEKTRTCHMIN